MAKKKSIIRRIDFGTIEAPRKGNKFQTNDGPLNDRDHKDGVEWVGPEIDLVGLSPLPGHIVQP